MPELSISMSWWSAVILFIIAAFLWTRLVSQSLDYSPYVNKRQQSCKRLLVLAYLHNTENMLFYFFNLTTITIQHQQPESCSGGRLEVRFTNPQLVSPENCSGGWKHNRILILYMEGSNNPMGPRGIQFFWASECSSFSIIIIYNPNNKREREGL